MLVLVINTNRTFLKYQLIRVGSGEVLAKGLCDRIGLGKSSLSLARRHADPVTTVMDLPTIEAAVNAVQYKGFRTYEPRQGVIKNKSAIEAVGHRIVRRR